MLFQREVKNGKGIQMTDTCRCCGVHLWHLINKPDCEVKSLKCREAVLDYIL